MRTGFKDVKIRTEMMKNSNEQAQGMGLTWD